MKHLQTCYVIDCLAEKILGKFPSPNEAYARKIFSDFVNDKKNQAHSDVILVFSEQYSDEYETFNEINDQLAKFKTIGVLEILNNEDSSC